MKKIFAFLLMLIFASCNDNLLVDYTDEEFVHINKGSVVVSKGQSKTINGKVAYIVGLKKNDSTWNAYGVSKNVYNKYGLGDTVKCVEPVIENENINKNNGIEKIDVTIYFQNDTLKLTKLFETN